MSESIDRPRPDSATQADPSGDGVRGRRRWTRARTIWLLIASSLSPGIAAAADREWWGRVPAGVRLSAYILSGILILVACALILFQEDESSGKHT